MDNIITYEKNTGSITIKIRTESGCFCKNHSKETNRIIDEYLLQNRCHDYDYIEHESGPEIVAWLALIV